MFPLRFVQVQWLKVKRVAQLTKNVVLDGATTVKKTVIAIKHKTQSAKNAVSRTAKDRALSLPGISKIKLPEAPFPHLLHSNIPPSDFEAIDILKVVSAAEAQSLHLQEIIQEHGPDRMTKYQFNRACQFVHAYKGVLSVIRRMPPELLQEIFILATLPWPNSRDDSWALSQVCRLWRTTALSVSVLWNRLPTIFLHKKTSRSFLAQISELLVRSRDAPISFYLYAPWKELDSHPIIDILVLHSERWQSVTINSTKATIFAFKGVKGRLSSLRTLSLEVWRQTEPVVFDIFEDAPQLRTVKLDGSFPGEIRLPFSQLTHYKERLEGRGMANYTIPLATSLTTLELARFPDSPDIPVITFPFLVTLKVQCEDIPRVFLENLTFPAIQEIWIAGFSGHFISVLTAMISRSRSPCMLKKLTFRTSDLDSGELTRLLKLTPHLVDLQLPLPPPEDLTNLIIGRNHRPLVPLLEMLTFDADTLRSAETSQVLNALAVSRCNLQNSFTSAASKDVRVRRALKELRIIFKSPRVCHYELRFLENWLQSEASEQLEMWKEKLVQELPELEGQPAPRLRRFELKWCDRVLDIFSEIEKFQVKNVTDIYISGIHTILRHFANRTLGRSIILPIADKAREILEKWVPLFKSHLKHRRWVSKGPFSLVYLSTDDALRMSPSGLDIEDFPKHFGLCILDNYY